MLSSLAMPDAVRELAQRLGRDDDALPAYVYDLDGLAAHTAGIRAALPDRVELCYAVKANPDPAVLRAVTRHADGLEISSAGELRHARAAVPGVRLSFGGPGKTAAEIAAAIGAGTFRFHVESLHELRLLGSAALAAGRQAEILLRVNLPAPDAALALAVTGGTGLADALPDAGSVPGSGTDAVDVAPDGGGGLVMGGQPTPFGMDPDVLDRCGEWLSAGSIEARQLRLRGIHAHLASGLAAPALLGSALRVLEFARGWCAARGVRNPEFNLGGGMAVDYRRPEARFDWASFGRGLASAARPGETLRVEPGRAVTAYCGWYVTRVLDVKRSQGRTFAVVAGGTHHLRTPVAKGHDQPFTVVPVAGWPHGWARPAAAAEPVTIVGQLCTPKDILARDVPVARLRAADLVAFGLAGAYAWNISHHSFLMHPAPGFHYVGTG
jgi:diaminopimelate decarboxylase